MSDAIERLMAGRYYDADDNVRIYRVSSRCEATVFGKCGTPLGEDDDIFI